MSLRKAWNHSLSKEARMQLKPRALRGLFMVLLLMLGCTLLSRVADGMTIAQVVTARPQPGALTHVVSLTGTLKAAGDMPVAAPSGLMVEEVCVEKGERVALGGQLLRYDTQRLLKEEQELADSLKLLELQYEAARRSASEAAREKERQQRRAQEDQAASVEAARRQVAYAQEDLDMAKADLSRYESATRKERHDLAQMASGTNLAQGSANDEIQTGALQNAIQLKERALEQAQLALEDAQRAAARAAEDARLDSGTDTAAQQLRLQMEQTGRKLSETQQLLQQDGWVYAPSDALVTGVDVQVGQLTGENAAIYLNKGEDIRFYGEIGKEATEYVAVGDAIELTLAGEAEPVRATVSSVTAKADAQDRYTVTAQLPEGTGLPGQAATGELRKRSKNYTTCVPIAALYLDGLNAYVLAVRQTQSVLGDEQAVARVDVKILDRNESTAAVEGALDSHVEVVVQASRQLREGDRVRVGVAP